MQRSPLMASFHRTRSVDPQDARMSDLLVDHALTLLLADEPEAALRWSAAALEHSPSTASALVVTSRLLEQMGRTRAAVDGFRLAVRRAIDAGNVPLAIAAIDELRAFGVDVGEHLDQVADAFSQEATPSHQLPPQPVVSEFGNIQPLSPFLTGPSLASKAAQILQAAKQHEDDTIVNPQPFIAPVPLFSALPKEALRELLGALEMTTVPAGHRVVHEGQEGNAAYFVARGELEVSRRAAEGDNKPRLVLARLGAGAFFGEMALLGHLPGAASVRATRPSILLVARRDSFEAIAAKYPEAAAEIAAHCRRHMVANLGWASPVVAGIPAQERAMLVERLQTRIVDKGDMLINEGEEAQGLHLIVSGEVAVFGRDRGERIVLATLTAGETIGEVELVLCRNANADAIATRPTATLFLPRQEFYSLVQDHPAILHGLYGIAVRRHTEMQLALDAGSVSVDDDWELKETMRTVRPSVPRLMGAPGAGSFDTARMASRAANPSSERPRAPTIVSPQSHGPAGALPTSYAPTSASLPPTPSMVPVRGGSLMQLTILPAAAVIAVAATFATTIALRSRSSDATGAATRLPASEATATPTATPTPTATATAPATAPADTTPMVIVNPLAPPPVAEPPSATVAHAKVKVPAAPRAKTRIVVAPELSAKSPADTAPPASSAIQAAASASSVPKPQREPAMATTAAGSKPDEFGGRE
jgi:CRP-like cAMP-binding protein